VFVLLPEWLKSSPTRHYNRNGLTYRAAFLVAIKIVDQHIEELEQIGGQPLKGFVLVISVRMHLPHGAPVQVALHEDGMLSESRAPHGTAL
jgi:hypothetical protein